MDGPHYFTEVMGLLVRLGINPADWSLNHEEPGGGRVVLALPESRVALALEGDTTEPLEEDGWHVERLSAAHLQTVARAISQLSTLSFEHRRRLSAARMLKSGSKEEQRLLDALLLANIAEPDRNFVLRRENGQELTVPDFAWPKLRLAFFVDGLWWHRTKDDSEKLEAIREAASDKAVGDAVMEANASRAERDAANRSEMVMLGWRVLSCTDRDLDTDAGVQKQVQNIIRMMRTITAEQRATPSVAQSSDDAGDGLDLL